MMYVNDCSSQFQNSCHLIPEADSFDIEMQYLRNYKRDHDFCNRLYLLYHPKFYR